MYNRLKESFKNKITPVENCNPFIISDTKYWKNSSPRELFPEQGNVNCIEIKDIEEEEEATTRSYEGIKENLKRGPDQVIQTEDIRTWVPEGAVKLKIGKVGNESLSPISVPSLVKKAANQFGNYSAMVAKQKGKWKFWTYNEYYKDVRTLARAFIGLGLQPFHSVFILGFNSPEWVLADLAAIFAGGFSAGVYTDRSPETCQQSANSCRAQIVVVGGREQLNKILQIKDNLQYLKHIIQYGDTASEIGVLNWDEVMELGMKEPELELEKRLKAIAVNHCCTIIVTSGTTGSSKSIMLSHDNLTWVSYVFGIYVKMTPKREVNVSYLPLAHISAQMSEIYLPLHFGNCVCFTRPEVIKTELASFIKLIRPTKFVAVPLVWEKFYTKLLETENSMSPLKRRLFNWAKSIGLEVYNRRQKQNFRKPLSFALANFLVFKKVKKKIGLDRVTYFMRGAAPMSWDIVKYFCSLNIWTCDIYGMSESAGPHVAVSEKSFLEGCAGETVPGCDVKLINVDGEGNGEVCLFGRNTFMGYLDMADLTETTLDDEGWVHSGDIGRFDERGYLYVTGRIKELLIISDGTNIPYLFIENRIKSELPCISNVMLVGDKMKYLSALLAMKTLVDPNTGQLLDILAPLSKEWCSTLGSTATSVHDILSVPDKVVFKGIQDSFERINAKALNDAQKVLKWTLLPKDFSTAEDELGPTMKMRRSYIANKYAEEIRRMYEC